MIRERKRALFVTAESNAGLRPAFCSALPTAGGLPLVVGSGNMHYSSAFHIGVFEGIE